MSLLEKTLQDLSKVVAGAKKKTQNTSLDKYELLWNIEEHFKGATPESLKAVQSKYIQLFLEITIQDPTPPLKRVISQWIVRLCSESGSISQALTTVKAYQNLLTQKSSLNTKLASLEIIGKIYQGLGVSVASAAGDSVQLLIKQFKSSVPEKRALSITTISNILTATGSSGVHLHALILKNIKQVSLTIINNKLLLLNPF